VKESISLVLSVLRLLTPQELKRLAHDNKSARSGLKRAAGAELLVWDDEVPSPVARPRLVKDPEQETNAKTARRAPLGLADDEPAAAKVLSFPSTGNLLENIGVKSAAQERAEHAAALARAKEEEVSETDFLLEERDKFKDTENRLHKQCGLASYQRSSDIGLFRVVITDETGKERSKLTSSQGVLVNKKQS